MLPSAITLDGRRLYGINEVPTGQGSVREVRAKTVERVSFPSRRGARLAGVWHAGMAPAGVILCHGMESSKEGTKSVRLADTLATAGSHVLRFDFSYVGESDGEFADLTISGEVEDLAGAWQFARQRVDGPIGIVGSSLGGTVALLFAAAEPEVAAVATIAAVATPGRFARGLSASERQRWRTAGIYDLHGMRLRYGFLEDVERLDVIAAVERIRCPLLVTHGTADSVVPYGDAELIAAHARAPCEVRAYENADHRFSAEPLLDRLLGDIAAWMLPHLGLGLALRRADGPGA